METNTPESNPALSVLKALGAVALFGVVISVSTFSRSGWGERATTSVASPATAEERMPTLDNRPTYTALKPPVREFSTPGSDVKELRLPAGRVYIGQSKLKAIDILPSAEKVDAEDDPEITITTPYGNHVGMRYVYRYQLKDGRIVIVRFQRKVPRRPFIGEAGTVHHPFVVHRVTIP